MKFKQAYREFSRLSEYTYSLGLLFARLAIGYGFYEPAMNKWRDIDGISIWFAQLGIPFPTLGAYLAASMEATGVIFLILGLFTRLISLPLMIVVIVAIVSVHYSNGFSAGNNGFEIPLYYLIFLFIFLSQGAGKFSLDHLFFSKEES